MVFLKSDQDKRLFEGWASVQIKDSQGETIPMDVLKPQMEKYMERDAPVQLNHTNWKIGKILSYDFRPNNETGKEGLWVRGKIHKHYPIDDDTWEHLDDGTKGEDADVLNEMSIAGQFEIGEDGVATRAAPMEISLTGPAVESKAVNPAATIEAKTGAKSEPEKKNSRWVTA